MVDLTSNEELYNALRWSLETGLPVPTTNGVISNVGTMPFAEQSEKHDDISKSE